MAGLLLNPTSYDPAELDPEARRLIAATIDWFEQRGKVELKRAHHEREWYADFLQFIASENAFATLLTPGELGGRWDTARICAFGEVLAFYGLGYWYTWQVTILGLGPIWQSGNETAKARAKNVLDDGGVFAFGLSEQAHGADIYSTDMVLTPAPPSDGTAGFTATGGKYYIGNGNVAGMVSVFGRRANVEGPEGYVFFAVDSRHPSYELVQNVVMGQMYVSEFRLHDYPVTDADILHTGPAAFDAALNTVNIGKFNLGFASIGICEHAFYEAITHADNRVLYGKRVTDFPHVRQGLTDAYARLIAMKLFGERAIDYFRSAAANDRRYLLFNPVTKMKVTTEGERCIDALWDVIAARGFEKDTYFEQAAMDIRALPKLEGTVHVNMALVLKFLPQYLLTVTDVPDVARRRDATDDAFLFDQGPARGLGAIGFGDWRTAYDEFADVPNVAVFREQAEGLVTLVTTAGPDAEQAKDLDLLLVLGELFTLVVYGQLILEQSALTNVDRRLVDQVFDAFVRDFSAYAVDLHGKASASKPQQMWALDHVRAPARDDARYGYVWQQVRDLAGTYAMRA
ncbi:MAG: acyl-CoA dehydrogenase [Actinomycetota bacterium]|jgi:alkylation response protein AidB-like acyl-CoA dehydrogenase|nr:acyl-CoA dehydrogenase [Actinomycetota bacterium]